MITIESICNMFKTLLIEPEVTNISSEKLFNKLRLMLIEAGDDQEKRRYAHDEIKFYKHYLTTRDQQRILNILMDDFIFIFAKSITDNFGYK